MYNLLSVEFIFYFFYSFLAIFLAIFIPGAVMLRSSKLSLSPLSSIVSSFVIGTASWVLLGFIIGFLNIRFVSHLYIIGALAIWIVKFRNIKIHLGIPKSLFPIVGIIILGILMQMSFGIFMGVKETQGISFCCIDASDNLYFLSLSHEIIKNIPPYEPGLSGVIVKNYHYLSNVFIADLSRVFMIPVNILQYQVSAVYLPALLGLVVLVFSLSYTKKIRYAFWLLIFVYFGGDFIWMLMIFLQKGTNFFSMSSLEDGAKFLSNPPRAFATVQLFGGLILLSHWLSNKRNIATTLILGVVFGTLIGFKVYVGIFAIAGLGALSIWWIIKRQYFNLLLVCICAAVVAIIYLPVNRGAGGLYFTSFWFFENFIVQPYLQLERLELARRIFAEDSKPLKAFAFEVLYVGITVFALFGTKLLGLIQSRKSLNLFPVELHIFLIAGIIPSLIVGFFFQQTSGGSNTFNFLVNVFVFGSIYTAATVFWLTSFKKVGFLIAVVIIGLTIPRVFFETKQNVRRLTTHQMLTLSNNQLNAFSFLSAQPKGLVVVDHTYFALDKSSPYIAYFSNQPMFLSGIQILESHNVKVTKPISVQTIIMDGGLSDVARAIKTNNISYIVLGPKTSLFATNSAIFLDTIYKNKEVRVLKANHQKIDTILKDESNGKVYEK